jgi:hypothetical protein
VGCGEDLSAGQDGESDLVSDVCFEWASLSLSGLCSVAEPHVQVHLCLFWGLNRCCTESAKHGDWFGIRFCE